MLITALKERARMLQEIRAFFYAHEVMEVETPALSQAGNTDPSIQSFSVADPNGMRYLHTSPEYFMKRLLVAGSGDIFQISRVWRQEEQGSHHNSEFTMLEWYRVDFSYHQLMQEVESLLQILLPDLEADTKFISYQHAFLEKLNIDPHSATDTELKACLTQHVNIEGELDRSAMLDVLMTHCIEPEFNQQTLTFVYDYPAIQQALSCLSTDKVPAVAMRFEVYVGQLELANGYQEQTDAVINRQTLELDAQKRQQQGMENIPVDERFLAALEQGMPRSAGVALGLDRVLMQRLGKKKLEDILSFPWTVA